MSVEDQRPAEHIEGNHVDPEKEAEELEAVRDKYLDLARTAFDESESFLDRAHKSRWRRNYALAQSEHPEGSKYKKASFAHRSKSFRGKTEATLRKNEAALAIAAFSNKDVVSITAENRDDPQQEEATKAIHANANVRLDEDIKWFLTAIGAYKDAMTVGNVGSEQYWEYEETDDGQVIQDKPVVELYPIEHIHISPNAKWTDPVNSSPYLILEFPMFVGDIKERMGEEEGDWIEYEDSEIKRAAGTFRHESVKQSREGEGKDVANSNKESSVSDFSIVYVRKNMIRHEGEELFYYTLADQLLLSDPVPLAEEYPHIKNGQRPVVVGTVTIEPHKAYTRSTVDRVAGLQALANEISNQRIDNVRQVLNKRKFVKRNMGVDYGALLKNVPGGITRMDELDAVKEEETSDVTSSAHLEQHLVNQDFDELGGSFSSGSVGTNRTLNETVGGMQLLKGDSNILTEYQLRVFVETWMEPVIRQVVQMIQFYEDDATLQQNVGDEVTHEMIQVPVKTRVSIGFGSTDPEQKINKLVYGIDTVMERLPAVSQSIDQFAIAREVFSLLGWGDGERFVPDDDQGEDPRIQQLLEEVQRLQMIIETDQHKIQAETEGKLQVKTLENEGRLSEMVLKLTGEKNLKIPEMLLKAKSANQDREYQQGNDSQRYLLDLIKEHNRKQEADTQQRELQHKITTGEEGI